MRPNHHRTTSEPQRCGAAGAALRSALAWLVLLAVLVADGAPSAVLALVAVSWPLVVLVLGMAGVWIAIQRRELAWRRNVAALASIAAARVAYLEAVAAAERDR